MNFRHNAKKPGSTMASDQTDTHVCINGENFSIEEIPGESTALVSVQTENLVCELDLAAVAKDLDRVVKFMRLAYNGANSSRCTDLIINIRRKQDVLAKLCEKSLQTIESFEFTSSDILSSLQSAYLYLVDGEAEVAHFMFDSISKLSDDMSKKALKLSEEFREAATGVKRTRDEAQKTKGKTEDQKKVTENQRAEFEIEKEKHEAAKKGAEEHINRQEKMYEEARQRQIDFDDKSFLTMIVTTVARTLPLKLVFDYDGDRDERKTIHDEKMKLQDNLIKLRQEKIETAEKIEEAVQRISNCRNEEELAQATIDALHEVIGGLEGLAVLMEKSARFWVKLHQTCDRLTEPHMKKMLMLDLKEDTERKRIRIWKSAPFKRQAMEYYARWVALMSVCRVHKKRVKLTQDELDHNMMENPTPQESKEIMQSLATELKELSIDDRKVLQAKMDEAKQQKELLINY